jgi:hypothetical protein
VPRDDDGPVITRGQLNRAVLARQLLLQRAPVSIPVALERMGCLQAQYAPAMYIGLWSRVAGLERDALTRALERRAVVQGTLMRCTIHLTSRRDYWPLTLAVRAERRRWWLGVQRRAGITEQDVITAVGAVRARLAAGETISQKDLVALVGTVTPTGVGLWLDLVRVPPSGTWNRRRADLYGLAEDWVGPAPDLDIDDATDHVVRRYLTGFGPATVTEIANWAGLKPPVVEPAVTRLRLRSFRTEDGAALVDLPRAPRPDADVEAPVRFLPVWDATLLAHARRALIIREEDRVRIFNTKTPHSMHTFLVDGQVAGTWRYDAGRIDIEPFRPLPKATRRQLDDEAERLAVFHR